MEHRHYDGRIIRVRMERVRLPNDVEVDLDVVRHPGAAAIVAATLAEVVLIRQYRFAAGGYLWEVPAGTLAPGESPAACARRELREEAGIEAGALTPLGHILTTPGFCDERIHLFLAQELRPVAVAHEADEVIAEVSRMTWPVVGRMIAEGEIVDAKSLVALYHAARVLRVSLGVPGAPAAGERGSS
jgi:ADP-ribose pyrophosphatase